MAFTPFNTNLALQAPDDLLPWLTHEDSSLTQKLKDQSGDTRLNLLQQSWSNPTWWDKQVLGLPDRLLFKRDILMYSRRHPCWYAKTIIPEHCYTADESFFSYLQRGVLTPLVFNEPKVQRKRLFHYAITPECLEFYWTCAFIDAEKSPLWLRFSIFEFIKRHEFYLVEIFLPNFIEGLT